MKYCDFCTCDNCQNGTPHITHARTEDGRNICDICWRYDVCVDAKRAEKGIKYGEKSRGDCCPCEDECGHPIVDCGHRPKLVEEFHK